MIKCYVLHKSNLVCLFVSYIFIRIQLCFYVNVRYFSDMYILFFYVYKNNINIRLLRLSGQSHIERDEYVYTTNTLICYYFNYGNNLCMKITYYILFL